jgi:uncharacterized protein
MSEIMATVQEFLENARFYTDQEPYLVLRLPAAAITVAASIIAEISDPFCALIVDKDEVTLIVPHEAPEEFAKRLRGHEISGVRYRLITVDIPLPPDLVGFMARISTALAEAGVPIFPYAAYSRDHLLVPEAHFEKAMAALQRLKAGQ